MGNSFDVAIAGGGIVGAAIAEECASSGLKVVVVERGPIGGGATAAGMGHLVVMDDSPAQIALTNYSRTLWMARAAEFPPMWSTSRRARYGSRPTTKRWPKCAANKASTIRSACAPKCSTSAPWRRRSRTCVPGSPADSWFPMTP